MVCIFFLFSLSLHFLIFGFCTVLEEFPFTNVVASKTRYEIRDFPFVERYGHDLSSNSYTGKIN